MGSDTTGRRANVNAPFSVPSRKTWKHSLTQLRSIVCWLSLWENPAETLFKFKIEVKVDYLHLWYLFSMNIISLCYVCFYLDFWANIQLHDLLWNGSTLICCRNSKAASISFRFTHWTPKLEKQQVMVEGSNSRVHTPFLQPSFPTKLCGWGR